MPSTLARPQNDTYCANMAALWRLDPRLAAEIDALGPDDAFECTPGRTGDPTLVVPTADGRRVALHSKYNPLGEAQQFADTLDAEETLCLVISGFGLAYHLDALRPKLAEDTVLVVIEPSLKLIKTALLARNLTALLSTRRLVILSTAETHIVQELLNRHSAIMLLGTKFAVHPASQQAFGDAYTPIQKAITDYISYSRMSLVTLVAISRATNQNIAANLPTYVATPSIEHLRNRFAGHPAIIVAAGPSLSKNMHLLANARGRAVTIAVQTIFKPLLDRGLVPDFVTSLDYNEVSMRFFEGIEDFAGVHLVAEPKAHHRVLDTYRGPVSLLDNTFARLCLGDELGERPGLKAGATVAHLSFYLAQFLGCDPIIFVGQDLAYSDHLFYTPGVPLHETWGPELNRFTTLETKEWSRILRRKPVLRRVQDIHGVEIFTDETLFTYLQQFEGDFAAAGDVTIIDASEGGAAKRGAVSMSLADALERYAQTPIPPERFAYREELNWFDAARLDAGRAAVLERLEQVQLVRDTSAETKALLEQLVDLVEQPKQFNELLVELDRKRAVIREHDRIYGMISGMCQLAELRKLNADLRMDRGSPSDVQRARRQLKRDVEFVSEFVEAADDLEKTLQHAVERFDESIAQHTDGEETAR